MKLAPVLLKLGGFLVLTLLCTALVANTLNRPFGEATADYKAEFVDVVGLKKGSDVRIAGIRVGRVNQIELTGEHATVSFEVTEDQPVPANVEAVIRYADMLGARYVSLKSPERTTGQLEEDATIPLERTRPAVDLTELFNGFAPVFETLQPHEVNKLANSLVRVFDGQGDTINSVLSHVVSLTENVAGQDVVIGQVLTNLRRVTDFALKHEPDFKKLVSSLSGLTTAMVKSRGRIAAAIDASSDLASTLSGVMDDVRGPLERDLRGMNRLAAMMVKYKDGWERLLKITPPMLRATNRTLEYASWLNVYVCEMTVRTGLPIDLDLSAGPHSGVCKR